MDNGFLCRILWFFLGFSASWSVLSGAWSCCPPGPVGQYLEGKTDRNIELMAAAAQLEPDFIKAACWPAIREDGSIYAEGAVNFQNWAVERGYMEKVVTPDVFWDGHFIEYANGVLNATTP